MEKLGYLLIAGMTNGSVYGLIGLSLSLIYGTNRVINFAQGDFVMLGAMYAILFMVTYALPASVAIPAVLAWCSMAVALALEFGVYRPLSTRGAAARRS